MSERPCVLYAERLPRGEVAGGYHYAAKATLGSYLAEHYRFVVPELTSPGDGGFTARFVRDLVAIGSSVAKSEVDVVHVPLSYNNRALLEVAQFALFRLARLPVVLDVRAGSFQAWWADAPVPIRIAYRAMMRGAQAVTAEMKSDLGFILKEFGQVARYSPSFVWASRLAEVLPADLSVAVGEPLRLVFAGRFSREKGGEDLLAGLRLAAGPGRRFHLSVCGGSDQETLMSQLDGMAADPPPGVTVEVLGFLPTADDVLALLQRQHLFLLPSWYFGEGHSNAVNQAMLAGLPALLTKQGHLPSIVPPEGGFFVDAHSPEQIAAVLISLSANPQRLAPAGAANRAWLAAHYTDTVALGAFEAAWRDAMEPRT